MAEYLRVGRLYLVLLAIFAVARFAQGAMGVDYAKAHHVFSIVILTVMASAFYAAFCRRWRGFRLPAGHRPRATVRLHRPGRDLRRHRRCPTLLGIETFFNHPTALNEEAAVPLARAVVIRARGLADLPDHQRRSRPTIGWALGGLLPETAARESRPPCRGRRRAALVV